jgi:hypothetical protein
MGVPWAAGTELYLYFSVCNEGLINWILHHARYVQYWNCISLFQIIPNATGSINDSNTFLSLIKVTNCISWIGSYFGPFCLVQSYTLLLPLCWNYLQDALVFLSQNGLWSFRHNMADHCHSDGNICWSRPGSLSISPNITCTPFTFCHKNTPPAVQVTTMYKYVIMSVNRFSNGTGMILA